MVVVKSGFASLRCSRARLFGPVVVAIAASILTTPASAAPRADADLTAVVIKARAAVSLPAVEADPAVRAAAGALLGAGNAQGAFASSGGAGTLITATVPAGDVLATAQVKSAVFDPRVSAIAVLRRAQTVAVAAALDPRRPFRTPVLAGATVDPGVAGSLAVLVPPADGTIPPISLQQDRGGELVTIDLAATAVQADQGALLVQLKGRDRITGPRLGYGVEYTLQIGGNRRYQLRTRPVPSALRLRSFASGPGFTGADRQAFLKTVSLIPPAGRKIVDVIGGAITVRVMANSAAICGAQTSCAGFDPSNGYFLILNRAQLHSPAGRFVITHELGHLVDFLGLDTFSHRKFKSLFSRSPKWKSCFPLGRRCTSYGELFADQFGFYSTNAHGVQSGYNDDRLATSKEFATLLQSQWAFRPPPNRNPLAGFGPLAKSLAGGVVR